MIKRVFQPLLFVGLAGLLLLPVFAQKKMSGDQVWREIGDAALQQRGAERHIVPEEYRTFRMNKTALLAILNRAPMEFTGLSDSRGQAKPILTLPMPDGTLQRFSIEESPIMEAGLAVQYPEIKTYRAQGIDD